MNVFLALCAGLTIGGVFGMLDLPTPAPPRLAGVVGIFGIYAGFRMAEVMG